MNRAFFSCAFFAVFLGVAALAGFSGLGQALAGMETPVPADLLRGKWSPQFEKALAGALPVSETSRRLWGRAEYALFHEGRKGVVVGKDGWLFTDEEFSCPAGYAQNMEDNLAFIAATQKTLARAGAKLVVVPVPAKARVLAAPVPACRAGAYARIRGFLAEKNIPAPDLLPVLRPALYLKADTHWTPDGARLAARVVSAALRGVHLRRQKFSSVAGEMKTHEGDLARYVPGAGIAPDSFRSFTTDAPAGGLLDDAPAPQAVLVGTSYSADADWNFAGFLKEALQADVLNVAEAGQGPFAVMKSYLASETWKSAPPRLVVWEMPERYFLMPL